jgi:hypothetical protein
MFKLSFASLIAGAMMLFVVAPATSIEVAAQDLQYTSKTSMELPGRAGSVMRWAQRIAGGSSETTETVYLKDGKMRTDGGESSFILDVDTGQMIFIDHAARTYHTMTFSDLASMSEAMFAEAEEAMEEARREAAEAQDEAARAMEEEGIEIQYDLSVDRTGETRSILGHRAERVFMTMKAEGKRVAPTEEEEDFDGAFAIVSEMWITSDAQGELQPLFDFQQKAAQQMGSQVQDMAASAQSFSAGLAAAFASDPQMRQMAESAAEEIAQMDGVALLTTMKMVTIPASIAYNPRAVFEEEEREEVTTTQRAGRLARGLVRNRLGRGGDAADDEEEREDRIQTLLTIRTEITDVQRTPLDNAVFEIPGDYRESPLFHFDD